jgi:hypothetical protein
VEKAVEQLLWSADLKIVSREKPELGSWFRSIKAKSSWAGDTAMTAAHAAESWLVTAQEAYITATMIQNLPPLLAALQSTRDAVIRVGALLIVKVDWVVTVHQLTAVQQFELDHNPALSSAPHNVLKALGIIDSSQTQASTTVDSGSDSSTQGS